MTDAAKEGRHTNRIYFLDNLRSFLIFLVVMYHSGLVYESSGFAGYFWIADDPATNDLVGILNIVIDIFVMATIFFISGYFTPMSLEHKQTGEFVKSKFRRLIIPWLLALLILMPLYKFIFLYSRDMPQESWTTYFHFSNGIFSQNWLWFLPVLFMFDMIYLLFARTGLKMPAISLKGAVTAVFVLGFINSFMMSYFHLEGWTKTFILDFQNERLLIYFLIFLLGAVCYKHKVFDKEPDSKAMYITFSATAWLPINIYVFWILYLFLNPGSFVFSGIIDRVALWISFHLSLLSLIYLLVNTFRFYFNRQGAIRRELNRNSYNVYIIHTIVLGAVAITMLDVQLSSLVKYLILTAGTFALSNLLVSVYRRVVRAKLFETAGYN